VLGIPLDKKIICYAGHLYDWKGADILAKSMHYLPSSYIAYLVGGTEEDVTRFREFTARENLANVVMVGHVAPTMIPGYLAASDVVVLPNVGEGLSRYTSPLKLFEYMAAKRPIVASDLPAIREILNEETAVLVAPGIRRLWPKEYRRLSATRNLPGALRKGRTGTCSSIPGRRERRGYWSSCVEHIGLRA